MVQEIMKYLKNMTLGILKQINGITLYSKFFGHQSNQNPQSQGEILETFYPGTPFSIVVEKIDNGKGYWRYNLVSIKRNGILVGSYIRNYSSFSEATFHPFKIGDDWYALYSKEYTATRVAKLTNGFEDWCGETNDAFGFCPTEYFVPVKHEYSYVFPMKDRPALTGTSSQWLDCDYEKVQEFWDDVQKEKGTVTWSNWALMSGCVWGDDTSWKLRYIDLSEIPNKVLKITERFGYWELPQEIRKCVRIYSDNGIKLTGDFDMNLSDKVPNHNFAEGFFDES